jgi:hypothetical protein
MLIAGLSLNLPTCVGSKNLFPHPEQKTKNTKNITKIVLFLPAVIILYMTINFQNNSFS